MSTRRMTGYERTERSLARDFGRMALGYIELARPWNRGGERFIYAAYEHAKLAARHASRAIDAAERGRRARQDKSIDGRTT